MGNPKVSVNLTKSNLGIVPADLSGVMGLVAAIPAANTSGYGVAVLIKSKAQAAAELADTNNAAILAAIQNGFYGEVAEGAPLYCVFVAQSTTLSAQADIANAYVAAIKTLSSYTVRAIAFVKYPGGGYTPTITNGIDTDVDAAVTKATAQAVAAKALNKPIEFLIQGYAATTAAAQKDYTTTQNPNVHIVIAGEAGDTVIPVLRALGVKASDRPSRNIGRVQRGSLNIAGGTAITIGTSAIGAISATNLDTFHDKGYITYVVNENEPGYLFNDDVSLVAATSDYSTWANNAVIGEAMRIAYATYYKSLKDDVDVDPTTGRVDVSIEKYLQQTIEDAITKQLGTSISAVGALVNPDTTQYAALYANAGITPNTNLLQTGSLYIFLTVTPKGYTKSITVVLGLGLQ